MNEAETRAEHIDPALKAAGWGTVEGSRIRREYPITLGRIEGHLKRGKALTADYVLEYRNTKLAVVEAKAWDEAVTEGVAQAKNYAAKLAMAHVAYALPPLSREQRATKAKVEISTHFNSKQQVFLDFVLSHDVEVGVEELDKTKLNPLLRLKYQNSISDAVAGLGTDIGQTFAGF
jgi:hypothetical protein